MKNRFLSYLLGWLFILIMSFFVWDVYAQGWDLGPWSTIPSDNWWEVWWWEWWAWWGWWKKCDGIKLNTKFPIIWDCISTKKSDWATTSTEVFPVMMWALTKIVITLILVVCFILVIVAWIKRSSDDPKTAKSILTKVAVTILLLWFSGVILRLINPNFFG